MRRRKVKKLKKNVARTPTEKELKAAKSDMIKSIVLSSLLLETLDSLSELGFTRHKLKNLSKQYLTEAELYLDVVWKQGEKEDPVGFANNTDLIREISSNFDKIFIDVLYD